MSRTVLVNNPWVRLSILTLWFDQIPLLDKTLQNMILLYYQWNKNTVGYCGVECLSNWKMCSANYRKKTCLEREVMILFVFSFLWWVVACRWSHGFRWLHAKERRVEENLRTSEPLWPDSDQLFIMQLIAILRRGVGCDLCGLFLVDPCPHASEIPCKLSKEKVRVYGSCFYCRKQL